jgi:hypothetical protein
MPSDKPNNGGKTESGKQPDDSTPLSQKFPMASGSPSLKKLYHTWGRSGRQTGRKFDTPDLVCRYPNIRDSLQPFELEGGMSLCSSYIHGVSVYSSLTKGKLVVVSRITSGLIGRYLMVFSMVNMSTYITDKSDKEKSKMDR